MTTGAGGAIVAQTAAVVSAGAGTSYSDTVQGLMQAINGSGLGVTATFTTATQAGSVASSGGKGADMGIEISGIGSGVAAQPTPLAHPASMALLAPTAR